MDPQVRTGREGYVLGRGSGWERRGRVQGQKVHWGGGDLRVERGLRWGIRGSPEQARGRGGL